jgi:hypothetical protein
MLVTSFQIDARPPNLASASASYSLFEPCALILIPGVLLLIVAFAIVWHSVGVDLSL